MIKKIIIAVLSTFLSINAFAIEEIFSEEIPLVWQPIITLSGGPAWANTGSDQYVYNSTHVLFFPTEHYIPNNQTNTLGVGEVFFGLQRVVYPGLTGQLGLGLAGAVDPEISGTVLIEGVPNVYTYQYSLEHARIELKGKLIANTYRIQPFISGSFGIALNNVHNWQPTSQDPILYPTMWYSAHSTAAFPYSVGAGLQAILNANWQVGVAYEFVDLGKSNLGSNLDGTIAGPSLTHLYTNQLLFSLSYVFN